MRNLALTFFVLFSLIFLACEKPTSEVEVEAASSRLDTIAAVVMNDSMWKLDSAEAYRLFILRANYINFEKSDSLRIVVDSLYKIAIRMNVYRDDSLSYYYKWSTPDAYGIINRWEGKLDESIENTLLHIKMLSQRFGEINYLLIGAYNKLGYTYVGRGDYEKGIECHQKALYIVKKLYGENKFYVGHLLSDLGEAYTAMGEPQQAIHYFDKAAESYSKVTPIGLIRAFVGKSKVYLKEGQITQAKETLAFLESIADSIYNIPKYNFTYLPKHLKTKSLFTGRMYHAWAQVLLEDGDVENAKKYISRLLEDSKSHFLLQQYLGEGYKFYGDALCLERNFDHALKYYQLALEEHQKIQVPNYSKILDAKMAIANLYLKKGDPLKALEAYQEIISNQLPGFSPGSANENPEFSQLIGSPFLIDLFHAKSKGFLSLYSQQHEPHYLLAALDAITLADQLSEKMRKSYRRDLSKFAAIKKSLHIQETGIQCALALHNETKDPRHLETAWEFAEKHKAAVLLESIRDEEWKSVTGITNAMQTQENQFKTDIAYYEKSIFQEYQKEYPDSAQISKWQSKLFDVKSSYDSLLTGIEKANPDYYRLKYGNVPIEVGRIIKSLKQDETLIEYFLGDSTLYTFTVNKTGLNYHQQKIDSAFFQTIDRLRHFANTPNRGAAWTSDYTQYITDARYLYQILLEPSLDTNSSLIPHPLSLIIIPDGILGYLPFNLLLTKEPDPAVVADYSYRGLPYLVSNYDIRYEYSATLMLESQKMRSKVRNWLPWHNEPAYCGFAPTYGDGEAIAKRGEEDSLKLSELFTGLVRGKLGALRFNRPEIEEASAAMEGKVFEAEAATEAEFKRQASQANILHLAMHALTNDREPLFSQLVFTQDDGDTTEDGRLHAYELQNMKLKADLAVLSACNTGAGKLQRGEGVMSLSRAFKFAGVPNVVMSLWQADDLSTKTIVGDFFRHLKAGMRKDKALCEAQRNFIKNIEDQRLTHPFYWSTFMLVGDGEPVFFNGIMRASAILWLAVLSLLIATAWFFRKKI